MFVKWDVPMNNFYICLLHIGLYKMFEQQNVFILIFVSNAKKFSIISFQLWPTPLADIKFNIFTKIQNVMLKVSLLYFFKVILAQKHET